LKEAMIMKRRHIPNLLTVVRLILACLLFALFSIYLDARESGGGMLGAATYARTSVGQFFADYEWLILNGFFLIFFIAGLTDWFDGYFARRWNVTTTFGRIADPFADKIMISGSFVLFVPLGQEILPIAPWMVVAILAREYLVTSIRGYAESTGVAFPSSIWGKGKMLLQSLCCGTLYIFLGNETLFNPWLQPYLIGLVWLTVGVTLISGVVYIQRARSILKTHIADVESSETMLTPESSAPDKRP
jgi:CDP-diacylglycerol---glycerol-3-phosphate 3-phosphatidyltransferase